MPGFLCTIEVGAFLKAFLFFDFFQYIIMQHWLSLGSVDCTRGFVM